MYYKVNVYKAQRIGEEEVQSVLIRIDEEIPRPSSLDDTEVFENDSQNLELLLHRALPGGTYDRLLGEMLRRQASKYIVSHGGLDAS